MPLSAPGRLTPSGQLASSAAPVGAGTCDGGAPPPGSGWLAVWIIHGLRVLEIIKMNGNKKLIKNFPNCFQVSLMGNRQPSLFPAPKSGGFTRLGAGQEGSRNSSGQVLLRLPELFQRRATSGVGRFSSSCRRLLLGRLPSVTLDFGAVGWREGTHPPPTQAGCSLCHGNTHPPGADHAGNLSAPRVWAAAKRSRCVRFAPLRGRLAAWRLLVAEAAAPDSHRTAGSGRNLNRPRRPEFVERLRPEVWRACAGVARGARTAGSAGRRGAHRA